MTQPSIDAAALGREFKVLKVQGDAGAYMPTHISTMEAVVIVIEGEAVIEMAGKDHALRASDTLVIPAGEPHSLVMKAKTVANVVMPIASEIRFR